MLSFIEEARQRSVSYTLPRTDSEQAQIEYFSDSEILRRKDTIQSNDITAEFTEQVGWSSSDEGKLYESLI